MTNKYYIPQKHYVQKDEIPFFSDDSPFLTIPTIIISSILFVNKFEEMRISSQTPFTFFLIILGSAILFFLIFLACVLIDYLIRLTQRKQWVKI